MSQVDYVHFFSNVVWSSMFFWFIYIILCIYYIQNIYKILRLRYVILKKLIIYFKKIYLNWNIISLGLFFYYNQLKDYIKNSLFSFINKKNTFIKIICL